MALRRAAHPEPGHNLIVLIVLLVLTSYHSGTPPPNLPPSPPRRGEINLVAAKSEEAHVLHPQLVMPLLHLNSIDLNTKSNIKSSIYPTEASTIHISPNQPCLTSNKENLTALYVVQQTSSSKTSNKWPNDASVYCDSMYIDITDKQLRVQHPISHSLTSTSHCLLSTSA